MAPWLSGGGVVAIVMRGSASFSGLGKRIGWPVGILRGEVEASVDILQDLFGGSSRRYGQKELARKCSFGHQKCDWQVERRWVKLWPMLMWNVVVKFTAQHGCRWNGGEHSWCNTNKIFTWERSADQGLGRNAQIDDVQVQTTQSSQRFFT
jgi:hypothetical protein